MPSLNHLLDDTLLNPLRLHLTQKLSHVEYIDQRMIFEASRQWLQHKCIQIGLGAGFLATTSTAHVCGPTGLSGNLTRESGETPRQQRVQMVNRKLKRKVFYPNKDQVDLSDIGMSGDDISSMDADFIVENVMKAGDDLKVVSTENVDFAVGGLRNGEIDQIDCTGKVVSDMECSLLGKLLMGFKSNLKVLTLSGEYLGYDALNTFCKFLEVSDSIETFCIGGLEHPAFFHKHGIQDPAICRVCERLGRLAFESRTLKLVEVNAPIEVWKLKNMDQDSNSIGTIQQYTMLNWRMDTLGERALRSKGVTVYDVYCLSGFLSSWGVNLQEIPLALTELSPQPHPGSVQERLNSKQQQQQLQSQQAQSIIANNNIGSVTVSKVLSEAAKSDQQQSESDSRINSKDLGVESGPETMTEKMPWETAMLMGQGGQGNNNTNLTGGGGLNSTNTNNTNSTTTTSTKQQFQPVRTAQKKTSISSIGPIGASMNSSNLSYNNNMQDQIHPQNGDGQKQLLYNTGPQNFNLQVSTLTKLDFTGNSLTSDSITVLVPALRSGAPYLTTLVLKKNQVGRRGCRALAPLIEFQPCFRELDLSSYNKLDSVGAIHLADALKRRPQEYINNKHILLHLQSNNIGDEALFSFIAALEFHRPILPYIEDDDPASPKNDESHIGVDLTYSQGITGPAKEDARKWKRHIYLQ